MTHASDAKDRRIQNDSEHHGHNLLYLLHIVGTSRDPVSYTHLVAAAETIADIVKIAKIFLFFIVSSLFLFISKFCKSTL